MIESQMREPVEDDFEIAPVDPDLFLWCAYVYNGAEGSWSVEERQPLAEMSRDGEGDELPVPSMFAVVCELNTLDVPLAVKKSVMIRLLKVNCLLLEPDALGPYVYAKAGGTVAVAEPLMRACAVAKLDWDNFADGFDVPRLLADTALLAAT